jgi:polysaccharide export outer membrane protein
MKLHIFFFLSLLTLFSCTRRNLTYLSDLPDQQIYTESISNAPEHKIQPEDIISITVTSLNPESNALFNRGEIVAVRGDGNYKANAVSSATMLSKEGYLVGKDGFITFPVLGKVQLNGLTKTDARNKLTLLLDEFLRDPIVNVEFVNFRVTVIGEVKDPATFVISSDKVTILEALGLAGDMTIYGKRENVLVIREEGGVRTVARLNLNSKEVFSSPYFYLQQNDVVYVEPDKLKQTQASTNTRRLALITSSISILSFIIFRLRII